MKKFIILIILITFIKVKTLLNIMVSLKNISKDPITRFLLLLGFVLVIMVLITQLVGFVAQGFDTQEILNQFNLYINIGLGAGIILILFYFLGYLIKDDDREYGIGNAFASPGETPAWGYFKSFTNTRFFLLSLIVMGSLGFFISKTKATQTIFGTGVKFLEQQFTAGGSLLFTTSLVPPSENLVHAGFVIAFLTLFRFLSKKYNWGRTNFLILVYTAIPFTMGLIAVGNHLLRYQGSDIALMSVFLFWTIGTYLVLLTGSFVPFWVLHIANNFFLDIARFYSSDTVGYITWFSIIAMIGVYWYIYHGKNRRKVK